NVKSVELIDDASGIIIKSAKPNFRKLGPRFGKQMKQVSQAIKNMDASAISTLESQGKITLEITGEKTTFHREDIDISSEDIEGWLVATSGSLTVALDIELNEELRSEGVARELINRIQNLRKDSQLEVTDHIDLRILKNEYITKAIAKNKNYIKTETLSHSLELVDTLHEGTEVEFDNVQTRL